MTYVPAEDRYDHMPYRRCGRSGLKLPAISLGPVAELRRRPPARDAAGDPAPRLRPRHHPLRPGQQLRAALRLGRGELRAHPRRGPAPVARRARHLDQGGLRHVARPVWRVGLAQVPAREPRPEPEADGPRLRRHLLLAPPRPRHAARGDARRASTPRCARARRCTPGSPRTRRSAPRRRSRSCATSARRCSSTSPPTRCSTAGSSPTCSTCSAARASGAIVFSPLGQGMLTDRYLDGIPEDSRAAREGSLSKSMLSDENLERVRALNEIAQRRGQTLAQLALAWTLRDPRVTSTLIGASSVAQLEDNVGALAAPGLRRRRAGRDRDATPSTPGSTSGSGRARLDVLVVRARLAVPRGASTASSREGNAGAVGARAGVLGSVRLGGAIARVSQQSLETPRGWALSVCTMSV